MSIHIDAANGSVAPVVLLPGDPLRAEYMATNFLTDVTQYNVVRAAYGYTGTYQGQRLSIQATGMGIPSMTIYATELMRDFGAQVLIRTGTAGGLADDIQLRDIVLSQAASTDSSIIANTFGPGINFAPCADFALLRRAEELAQDAGYRVRVGNTLGEDRFYNDEMDKQKLADYGVLAAEMETPGLYLAAARYHRRALAMMTVSDHIPRDEHMSSAARQSTLDDMIRIALRLGSEAAAQLDE